MTIDDQLDQIRARLAPLIAARTQSAIAEATGVRQPHISAWLSGRRALPLQSIALIARECGLALELRLRRVSKSTHRETRSTDDHP